MLLLLLLLLVEVKEELLPSLRRSWNGGDEMISWEDPNRGGEESSPGTKVGRVPGTAVAVAAALGAVGVVDMAAPNAGIGNMADTTAYSESAGV